MKNSKQAQLEAAGWVPTTVQELLALTDEEMAYLEMKLSLSRTLRHRRLERGLTQAQFAKLIQSSQSRVSKMENGDPSISMDLLVRSLLALDTSKAEVAAAFAG